MNNTVKVTPEQEEAALAWLSRLHDQPGSGDRATFSRWLLADPAHAEAYAQAQLLWERCEGPAGMLAKEDTGALQGYLDAMDNARAGSRRRPLSTLAMAACLVLTLGVAAGWQPTHWLQDIGTDYVSAAGEVRTVTLADQSQLTLDADSAIAVDFSHGQRHVQVRRGAVFFSVAHTGGPFVVEAQGGETRVLGTRFEVRVQPLGAQVTVLSGRVGISPDRGPTQQILSAGQQVEYAQGSATGVHPVDSEAHLAWRSGWLNYYQVPLAEVVKDLGRYYPGRIMLLDSELGARKVSGSFPSGDPQAVLDSLRGVLGFEQHNVFGRLIMLR